MKINMHKKLGFTLIELMIAIAVLAIIVSIVSLSYTGIQRRAAETGVISDMDHIAEALHLELVRGNEITNIPDEVKLTKDTNVTFIQATADGTSLPKYTNLTPVQNGLLFYNVGCLDLWQEDRPDAPGLKYGQGRDAHGNMVKYIWGPTSCNVYNYPQIQFNASWGNAGGIFNVPVTEQDLLNYINNVHNTDPFFPDFEHVVKQFYQAIHDRFLAQGGTFPIEKFWDPWCNQMGLSWCVFKEELPPIDPSAGGAGGGGSGYATSGAYCVQASHNEYTDISFYLMSGQDKPSQGVCPAL